MPDEDPGQRSRGFACYRSELSLIIATWPTLCLVIHPHTPPLVGAAG